MEQFLRTPWVEDPTMVLVDHRGVGASQPSLACPELDAVALTQLSVPVDEPAAAQQASAARLACRARLVAAGIDLAWRSSSSRRHPEGIRPLVLDAALPPQGNLPGELWPHAQRAFDALFAGCAADRHCAPNYPDLAGTVTSLLGRLRSCPVTVEVRVPSALRPSPR